MIEVTVRQHGSHRLEVMFLDDLADTAQRVHAGVDDDALRAGRRSKDIAVGLPVAGGERGNEHDNETIGQDRTHE